MTPSLPQILIVLVLLVLLFGRGKISELMGDVAKGIKSFRKGMSEDPDPPTKTIDAKAETVNTSDSERDKAAQG